MNERTFLEGIDSAPDDDDRRLVFADWLTSRGDPRGEFIVVQVALAKLGVTALEDLIDLPSDEDAMRAGRLWRRQEELLDEHELTWINDAFGDIDLHRVGFRRGFVHHADVATGRDLELLAAFGERRRGPPIESVKLRYGIGDGALQLLATKPVSSRLRALAIDTREVTAAAFARLLASCPRLERIDEGQTYLPLGEHLDACVSSLRSLSVRGLTAERMTRTPCLRAVESLDLCGYGARAVDFLDASVCPELARVALRRAQDFSSTVGTMPAFDATSLAARTWPKITALRFEDEQPRSHGDFFGALLDALPSTLESLDARGAGIRDGALAAIARPSRLGNLKALTLPDVTAAGFAEIAQARHLALGTLRVANLAAIEDASALEALFATHRTLRDLALGAMVVHPIQRRDLLSTIATNAPATLRSLRLGGFDLTSDEHIATLVRAPRLSKLRRLVLTHGAMGNGGARIVSESAAPSLVSIDLGANGVRGHGIRAFARAKERFPRLAELRLGVFGDTLSYQAVSRALGARVFSDTAEIKMASGEPYWTWRDGEVSIARPALAGRFTAEDAAGHLEAMVEEDGARDLRVTLVNDEVHVALSAATYPDVDPIAMTITASHTNAGGRLRITYLVSDRHAIWPMIQKVVGWLSAPDSGVRDHVLDTMMEREAS